MLIRKAVVEDAEGIAKVHVDSWRSTYKGLISPEYLENLLYEDREKRWESIINNDDYLGFTFVAEDNDGKVIAFANGGPERENNEDYKGELYAIYILQHYQGLGIGKQLFQNVVIELINRGFHSMLVWVLENNPSRGFYEKMGGVFVKKQELTIGENNHTEFAYGWKDISTIVK